MKRAGLAIAAAIAITAGVPSPAAAHDLTCSKSRFGHWFELSRDKRVKVDDLRGYRCVQIARNRIRLVWVHPRNARYVWRQDIAKVAERTYGWENSPFYHYVRYRIGAPRFGTHG